MGAQVKVRKEKVAVAKPTVALSKDAAQAVSEYGRLGLLIKALEDQRNAARDTVLAALGEAEIGTYKGAVRVTKTLVTREGVDAKLLKEAFPEAFAAARTETRYPRISPK